MLARGGMYTDIAWRPKWKARLNPWFQTEDSRSSQPGYVRWSHPAAAPRSLYRRRGAENIENIKVQKLIECRGLDNDPTQTRNPIIRTLVKEGFGRPDPLRISLEVTNDCAVIDVLGKPSERLFAIGPLTRAVFWEIIAVPDIRVQCAKLAELIVTRASQQDAA